MALKHPAPPRRLFVIGCAVVMLAALVGLWPLIRSALRSTDLLARFGGQNVVAVLRKYEA